MAPSHYTSVKPITALSPLCCGFQRLQADAGWRGVNVPWYLPVVSCHGFRAGNTCCAIRWLLEEELADAKVVLVM
jgi:hypothetical protein